MKYIKKLIEVALPLDDINEAAAKEKSIRHGHPSTLHLWWAPRPIAVARAVLFAQLVNDPGGERGWGAYPGQTKADAQAERDRLFDIIRRLVQWENSDNEILLEQAREEIRKSWVETCKLTGENPNKLPSFHDPFAGGGAIPLEAQRLGLESFASDLNPVAVLINKAKIEIPPKFAGREPVGPVPPSEKQTKFHQIWTGSSGLAEDVRRYGAWMREEAFNRVGHLYPDINVTNAMVAEYPSLKFLVGKSLKVIAVLWARTVTCPNPACHCKTPLLSSFVLSSKQKKETYLIPAIDELNNISFEITSVFPDELGNASSGFKRGMSGIFQCIKCKTVTSRNYTSEQAKKNGLSSIPTAVVCEGENGRLYLPARYLALPSELPTVDLSGLTYELAPNPRDVWCRNFGLNTPADLFTARQLVALTTYSGLVTEAHRKVKADALAAGWQDDGIGLQNGGAGATAYADAVGVYLGLAVDKLADYNSCLVVWSPTRDQLKTTFSRQALPMVWDFAETNTFAGAAGDISVSIKGIARSIEGLPSCGCGYAVQADAQSQTISSDKVISTDPPYYDNIGYADLSDFFYAWLRKSLKPILPELFATMAVPKEEELVATSYRHVNKVAAEAFFLSGMTQAMNRLVQQSHQSFPVTIYYAFKQSETAEKGTASTGWETFLEAVLNAGFSITGTWPMRTERKARSIGLGTNALASSIVLVCRKRLAHAETVSRKSFIRELEATLPEALEAMIGGEQGVSPIAPVDLAQAAIGPGMAIFSNYAAVVEADGSHMKVHNALILINKAIDEYFTHAESDMDADTRFCVDWFQQFGFKAGVFGEADVLARAKGTSVDGVRDAGVVESKGGNVRLLKVSEFPAEWDPTTDDRTPIWEACHQMSRALQESEAHAGALLARMPEKVEPIRQLAYRLYTLCERKGWAEEARAYNELIISWHAIAEASHEVGRTGEQQILEL